MKTSITLLTLFATGLLMAQSDQKPADKDTSKKAAAKKLQPLSIPKDAVQNLDGTYSYTDKAGKKWKYVNTPFGVMRSEDSTDGPAPAAAPVRWTKATDNGETVTFERQTPFGPVRAEKKKSDLTADERAFLDSQTAPSK
ncbi:MAG: hypothetical protein ABSB15_19610 [Bryobacteraceae bacterium]|jgi:hypothetical protein